MVFGMAAFLPDTGVVIARLFEEDDHFSAVDAYLVEIPPKQVKLSYEVYLESVKKFKDNAEQMLPLLKEAMSGVATHRRLSIEDLGPDHIDPVVDLAFSKARRNEGFYAW